MESTILDSLKALKAEAATLPGAIQKAAKARDMNGVRVLKNRLADMPMLLADAAIRQMEARLAELAEIEPAFIAESRRARQAAEDARKAWHEAWKVASAAEFAEYAAWSKQLVIAGERDELRRRIAQIEGLIDSQNVVTPAVTTGMDSITDLHWMNDVLKH